MGASVLLASVDLADAAQVRDFVRTFVRQGWPALRGVVHAAGTLEPGSMLELTPDALRRHVGAKVGGAWTLHQAFADAGLDLFVLFSSASSVLSSPFLGAYAAANASLDALAHLRRRAGQPAMSINWGFWGRVGLAERERGGFGQTRRGLQDLPPEQGVQIFERLLDADATQVAVLPMDWGPWALAHAAAARSPFVAGLVTAVAPEAASGPHDLPPRDELLAQDPLQRLETLTRRLSASIAAVLQVDEIDVDQPLAGLGLDSLMAVELKNRIEGTLAVALPIALLMDNASVRRLAEHVCQELSASGADAEPTRAPIRRAHRGTDEDFLAAVLAEVESLSQEAVDTQIKEHTS
jgi:acyl carrier protein